MKIEMSNLGSIRQAEIDIKPLTIFIGENNMGKTWLAYVLSGILGPYGCDKYAQAYTHDQLPRIYPPLDAAIEKIQTEGSATIDLHKFAEGYGELYFQNVAE